MGIVATIFMIVVFPFNSLLVFQQGIKNETQVKADFSVKEESIQAIAMKTEVKKPIEAPKPKAQAVDSPQYQPVRKDGVKDLVIPNAHASVIIDADTGTILHYNNGRTQRQIASLTKLMTAILVMENIKNLDEEVTIDEEPVYADGTKIGCPRSGYCISQRLKIGEKITVRSLLQAMLMNSANDAAIALGKHMAKTQDGFADVMNKKATDLGLVDTHFCTPSGLEPDGRESECFSSAYDIARIGAYSLRYDTIWKIARQPNNTIISSADGKIQHTILNTDQLLDQMPNMIGSKTGFTPLAGYSLLLVAADPTTKHRAVAVLLDDSTRWTDIRTAIDWTFKSHIWN
ncbi:MAG: serine hydrolase [bacterium]